MQMRMRDGMTVLAGDILLLILLAVAVHAYLSCALGILGCGCNDGVLKDCLVFQIGSGGTGERRAESGEYLADGWMV